MTQPFVVPDDLAAALPARAASEQEWQNAMRLVLPRWLPLRLFRCVTGKKKVEHGAWMQGAPVGAADLNGWLRPTGRRVEIECKFAGGAITEQQQRWIDTAADDGCVALVARYEPADDLVTNLQRVALALSLRAGGVS